MPRHLRTPWPAFASRLTITRKQPGVPLGCGVEYVTVTAAEDGVDHLISLPVYDQCVTDATGRYVAVCGRTILGAALTTASQGSCSLCRVEAWE